MSSYAVGIHEELLDEYGQTIVGTDQYFKRIDRTMRDKFPEYFDTLEDKAEPNEEVQKPAPKAKPSTVVAPATRSTASKQVKLKTSQQAIAKKLGLTPEQYARELMKLEAL
jgi:HJR/Mrr/RecB family endonuclease